MLWKKEFVLGLCALAGIAAAGSVQAESPDVVNDVSEVTSQNAIPAQTENSDVMNEVPKVTVQDAILTQTENADLMNDVSEVMNQAPVSDQTENFGVIHDRAEMANQAAAPVQIENIGQELPVIAQWQDGHGYQEDGTPIAGSWAYDSVNPAGKYVLFGEDGAVVRKSESMGESGIGEDYTGTEMVPAVIALRAKTFKGFQGTISVLLEEKSGLQKRAELNAGNFYSLNISVNSGDYALRQVEAKEQETYYKVKFSTDAVYVPEQGMRMMKIRVKNKKLEPKEASATESETEARNTQEQMTESNGKQSEMQTVQQERQEGKEEGMRDMSLKKVVALFASIGAACMAGVFLLRRKRR